MTGERFETVVCATPVGPLRRVAIEGVSDERRASLDRQRHALAAKVVFAYETSFWEEQGQNGDAYWETGVLRGDLGPARGDHVGARAARAARRLSSLHLPVEGEMVEEMVQAFGERSREFLGIWFRRWGVDPWTEGYITFLRPGDVMAVGPLHGTHEPPFYVCGSDQWVCGYMEGAVRTAAARPALRWAHRRSRRRELVRLGHHAGRSARPHSSRRPRRSPPTAFVRSRRRRRRAPARSSGSSRRPRRRPPRPAPRW